MNKVKSVIEGLAKAIDLEHRVMKYYKRAGDEARASQVSTGMYRLEERHQIHVERLESERERLHREAGNGFFAEALASFGEAINDIVAGLPRTFIEAETFPTFETLVRCEEQLIDYYQTLRGSVDPSLANLIDATIADCNENIALLRQMDGLS